MIFCCTVIAALLAQVVAQMTAQQNSAFFGITVLDCSQYIPNTVYQMMQQYNPNSLSNLMIPTQYLQNCLNSTTYNKYIGPYEFSASSTTWTLSVGMAVSQLVSLDTVEDLQLKVDVNFQWNDPRLQWNAFTNLSVWQWPTKTYLPSSRLWMPEITVLTCELESCSLMINPDTFVDISNDGTVDAHESLLLTSSCLLDFTYFPYDNQTCVVNMLIDFPGTEDYRIQLQLLNSIETDYIDSNSEWDITSVNFYTTAALTYQFREVSPTDWTLSQVPVSNHSLVLVLGIKRTPAYYVSNLIIPVMIIILIGVLSIILPSDAIERPGYVLSVVLAYIVYQLTLANMEPKSEIAPLIGVYISLNFVLLAGFLVCSCYVCRLWRSDPKAQPPRLIRLLFIRPIRMSLQKLNRAFRNKRFCCTRKNNGAETIVVQVVATQQLGEHDNSKTDSVAANSGDLLSSSSSSSRAEAHGAEANGAEAQNMEQETKSLQANNQRDYEIENWHTLALYLQVLTSFLFVCGNVALFCAIMVPVFVVGARNSATPIYYNKK